MKSSISFFHSDNYFLFSSLVWMKKIFSFWDVKEVSDRAVITACQIAPAQEIISDFFFFFFFFWGVLQNKSLHPSLICLGRVPLAGGSVWKERVLLEDYRKKGVRWEDRAWVCMCVGDEVWWRWGCKQFYPKCCNCPQDCTVQSCSTHFLVYSLSPLYLLIFVSHKKLC